METTVSIPQSVTADNGDTSDRRDALVNDINIALGRAGLGGMIFAERDNADINLVAVDDTVFDFAVSAAIDNVVGTAGSNLMISGGDTFNSDTIGSVQVGDVVLAEGFVDNGTNGFFKVTGIDGNNVTVTELGGGAAALVNNLDGNEKLSIVSGSAGLEEFDFNLGYAGNAVMSTNTASIAVFASNDLRESTGRFGQDLTFDVSIDGGPTVTVLIGAVDDGILADASTDTMSVIDSNTFSVTLASGTDLRSFFNLADIADPAKTVFLSSDGFGDAANNGTFKVVAVTANTIDVVAVDDAPAGLVVDGSPDPAAQLIKYAGVDTSTNNGMFELASDINRALRNVGLQEALDADRQITDVSQLRVEAVGDYLLFTGGTGVLTFSITANAASSLALGLKDGLENSDKNDLILQTHSGATYKVAFDGTALDGDGFTGGGDIATTVADVITQIVNATGGSGNLNAASTLDDTDNLAAAGNTFTVTAVAGVSAGDVIEVRGFARAENNGIFLVSGVTGTDIQANDIGDGTVASK